jgi:hypothetical protein
MAPRRQRELALGSIAILVLAVALWILRPAQPPVATGNGSPAPQAAPGAATGALGEQVKTVNLEALDADRPEPEASVRNPFRFKTRAAPPPTPGPVTSAGGVKPPQPVDAVPGPPQPPPPPRITLKYIGDMADPIKPGGKVAILADSRGVYYGREGEVIEGRYRIVKIGVESVDLAYLDGRGRQTIRQNGQ